MNILHTETLKGWGGEQNKVINEMVALKELGHNVYLICNPASEISKKEIGKYPSKIIDEIIKEIKLFISKAILILFHISALLDGISSAL